MDWLFVVVLLVVIAIIVFVISLSIAWWLKIIIIIATYVFIVFVLSRLLIPHLGFVKSSLPAKVDPVLQKEIDKIQGSQEQAARTAFELVTSRFQGKGGRTFVRMSTLFRPHDGARWQRGGYANCHTMNYFIRLFLVKSGAFSDDDIKVVHVIYRYNIHQYLKIRVGDRWMVLDPGMNYAGIPFARKNDYWWNKGVDESRYDGVFLK